MVNFLSAVNDSSLVKGKSNHLARVTLTYSCNKECDIKTNSKHKFTILFILVFINAQVQLYNKI